MTTFILSNFCPLSETLFARRRIAIQHVENTKERYGKEAVAKCNGRNMNKKVEYQKLL